MKTVLSFLFFFIFLASLGAQQFNISTTRFVGTSAAYYAGTLGAIQTTDGGILCVGATNCYHAAGDIPLNFPDTVGTSIDNALVIKVDPNLNISWVKVYGGNRADALGGVVQTADGGYVALGTTHSNNNEVSGNHGLGDLWLIRIDANGNLLWQKCFGSHFDEKAVSISSTPDGGYIMLGISNGMGADVTNHYSGSQFDYDWFVVKTDDAGTIQWTKSMGGRGDEDGLGSIIAADDGYYLVSNSTSTDYDCADTMWHAGAPCGGYRYTVLKLDMTGNIVWSKSYGGCIGEEAFQAVWDARDTSIVIVGLTQSTGYMVTGNHGMADMWVVKIDRHGALKWEKCLGGSSYEIGSSIMLSSNGYIVYGNTSPGSLGYSDYELFALDMYGNVIVSKQFGGGSYDDAAIVLAYKQGFAAIGNTNSPGFAEGINIGHLPNPSSATSITYFNFWPLEINTPGSPKGQLTVYPNPSSADVNVQLPDRNGGMLAITNAIGQQVYGATLPQGTGATQVYTGYLLQGLYTIKWVGRDGTTVTTKLIHNL